MSGTAQYEMNWNEWEVKGNEWEITSKWRGHEGICMKMNRTSKEYQATTLHFRPSNLQKVESLWKRSKVISLDLSSLDQSLLNISGCWCLFATVVMGVHSPHVQQPRCVVAQEDCHHLWMQRVQFRIPKGSKKSTLIFGAQGTNKGWQEQAY